MATLKLLSTGGLQPSAGFSKKPGQMVPLFSLNHGHRDRPKIVILCPGCALASLKKLLEIISA